MEGLFNELLSFFGIPAMPQNLGEMIPWLFSILFAVCLVLYALGFISQLIRGFNR